VTVQGRGGPCPARGVPPAHPSGVGGAVAADHAQFLRQSEGDVFRFAVQFAHVAGTP